ncbi:MAG: hypothetical protein ACRD21_17080, partial [Vicinamibacteria bacterium]
MKLEVIRLSFVTGVGFWAAAAETAVIRVPSEFPTIQQAVNAAAAGDTIVVAEGRYPEAVTLKRGIRLHAVEKARDVIDAS